MKEKRIVFVRNCDILELDEKDRVLGHEPVTEFLPSAQLKSRNNLVLRDRICKADVDW